MSECVLDRFGGLASYKLTSRGWDTLEGLEGRGKMTGSGSRKLEEGSGGRRKCVCAQIMPSGA